MPRPRTGTAWRNKRDGRWMIQFPLPAGGSSNPVKLGAEVTTRERAKEIAKAYMERAIRENAKRVVLDPTGKPVNDETVTKWASRWLTERERADIVSVNDDEQRFEDHVKPVLGDLPIARVTKDDI